MLPGWIGAFVAIALFGFLLVSLRGRGMRGAPLIPAARREVAVEADNDAGARAKTGTAARHASQRAFVRDRMAPLALAALAFCIVAGLGAIASLGTASVDTSGTDRPGSEAHDEALSGLKHYARSIPADEVATARAASRALPDVETMIERLAARLQTAPRDLEGWRLLGWSYFHTSRYAQAVIAFTKALELDPTSAPLKQALADAQAKAEQNVPAASAPLQTGSLGATSAAPPAQTDPAIRAMVDGLADRLEKSPNDVEGWARLLRSRVVLGERDAAAAALRKALEVFKNDPAASGAIEVAAAELGLKAQ